MLLFVQCLRSSQSTFHALCSYIIIYSIMLDILHILSGTLTIYFTAFSIVIDFEAVAINYE